MTSNETEADISDGIHTKGRKTHENEELNAQKEEVETVSKKIHELTDEEVVQVVGGADTDSSTAYIYKVNVKSSYLRESTSQDVAE